MKDFSVLLTRPKEQNQAIIQEVENMGFDVVSEPMLEILPLSVDLPLFDDDTGLIFTSSRSLDNINILNQEIKKLPVYVVGHTTAKILKGFGFNNIIHIENNSLSLQNYLDTYTKDLPNNLIHICGEHIVANFCLKNANVKRIVTYNAKEMDGFTENLLSKIHNIRTVLFYSSRSAYNFIKLIKKYNLQEKCGSMVALCISVRVQESIKDVQWKNVYIAQKPSHFEIMKILQNIYKKQRKNND